MTKIEHARVNGIYKIIDDIKDAEDTVILPKNHIVQVVSILPTRTEVIVIDLTKPHEAHYIIDVDDMAYVTYFDLYGKDYQAEETKQNKDSPTYNQHYADMIGLQPIEVMQEVMSHEEFLGFLKGNIIKYTMRAGHKEGEPAKKDVAKAKRYAQWLNQARVYNKINPREEGGVKGNGTSEISEARL